MTIKIVKEYYDLNDELNENGIIPSYISNPQNSVCTCYFDDATKGIYAIIIPQKKMNDIINGKYTALNELLKPEVLYYLIYKDDCGVVEKIYVGQTERVGDGNKKLERMIDHLQKKKGWTEAIVFFSSAVNGGFQGTVKSLERYAIKEAFKTRYLFENDKSSKAPLNDRNINQIKAIYKDIFIMMNILGYNLSHVSEEQIFRINPKGIKTDKDSKAEIVYSLSGKYLLLPGSEINFDKEPTDPNISDERMRDKRDKPSLFSEINGRYYLRKIKEFQSISTATKYVCGGSRRGTTEWKNENQISIGEHTKTGKTNNSND